MKSIKTWLYASLFIISGIVFQISCSNSDSETTESAPAQTGKIVFLKTVAADSQIWTCDYDGGNATNIEIDLPAGVTLVSNNGRLPTAKISPDGQKLFFIAYTYPVTPAIYSCDISGQNVQLLVTSDVGNYITLEGVN